MVQGHLKKGEFNMETSDVNLKNWKSLIKPSKIDIDQNDEKTFAKVTSKLEVNFLKRSCNTVAEVVVLPS